MIEMGKKYQTRDGRAVRILCVDGPGNQPIVGIVEGEVSPDVWDVDGVWTNCQGHDNWDLVPVPTKHERWMLIQTLHTSYWSNKEALEQSIKNQALPEGEVVACVTWED